MRDDIPARYVRMFEKILAGKSRKLAIKGMCLECMGYDLSEIYQCTDPNCALFAYRPKPPTKFVAGSEGRTKPPRNRVFVSDKPETNVSKRKECLPATDTQPERARNPPESDGF